MSSPTPTVISGWPALSLLSEVLEVTVVPGKGGDIASLRHRPSGVELAWRPRWGLRPPTAPSLPGSAEASAMDRSGGGWNTLFPNAGRTCVEQGVEWGFHGETWLAPFDWEPTDDGVRMRTTLARSPFVVVKQIALNGAEVRVSESVTHIGADAVDVLWCQHPTFGAPLIGERTSVEITGCRVYSDLDDQGVPSHPALRWPDHLDDAGDTVDLATLLPPGQGSTRRAFLGDFDDEQVCARIHNPDLRLGVELSWSAREFPYAWYWHEAGGGRGYPWFGTGHAFAIEPATGYPSGLHRARGLTGTHTSVEPGTTVTKTVTVAVHVD